MTKRDFWLGSGPSRHKGTKRGSVRVLIHQQTSQTHDHDGEQPPLIHGLIQGNNDSKYSRIVKIYTGPDAVVGLLAYVGIGVVSLIHQYYRTIIISFNSLQITHYSREIRSQEHKYYEDNAKFQNQISSGLECESNTVAGKSNDVALWKREDGESMYTYSDRQPIWVESSHNLTVTAANSFIH